jgi:hypothetical protein
VNDVGEHLEAQIKALPNQMVTGWGEQFFKFFFE